MSSPIPKAVLYYADSAWSYAVRLALEEKGYGDDEIDLKIVDLGKGENFAPSFLRLNPKGTVPTLVVPFENTLSPDTESRYKAVTDVKAIVDLLDRSRSATSRTHTTSHAPAPSLSPATIAFCAITDSIVNLLHEGPVSPELLFYMNARNETELRDTAKTVLPFLQGRKDALERFLTESEQSAVHVSEKTKGFWLEKKRSTEELLSVFKDIEKEAGDKARQEYYLSTAAAWEVSLALVLSKLNTEIIGPFSLGDQFSTADVHVAAWLAWVIRLSGGKLSDSGAVAVATIEKRVGGGFHLAKDAVAPSAQSGGSDATTPTARDTQSKLGVFWDAVKERKTWGKVFGDEEV
ncbi:hypothetical protein DENSPDRAFT_837519 [Dentipellis sp. KUC8613]|nr:hypothetical protein DENSPDRAFT_837519 [Dentipellis sp. KUC8613]